MLNKKNFLVILFVLITFLISLGGVFAQGTCNESNSLNVDCDEALLRDNSYVNNQELKSITVNEDESYNDTSYIKSTNVVSYVDDSSDLSSSGDYQVNCPIINPDFEIGSSIEGWNYSKASIYNFANFAKNGSKFVSLSNGGHISQYINLDAVDSISFWYRSSYGNINVYIDDYILKNYTSSSNKWEKISIDLSNFSGIRCFKIFQHEKSGNLDYFNINYNDNLVANFDIGSFIIDGDKISVSFKDKSYGLVSNYKWSFGDGIVSNSQNPTHIFNLNHYNVVLTISNSKTTKSYSYNLPISFSKLNGIDFTNIQNTTFQNANIVLSNGNFIFSNNKLVNTTLSVFGNVDIDNCSIIGGGIVVGSGKSKINNCRISSCINAIIQNNGEIIITNNIIFGNSHGISVNGGSCKVSFNAIYSNDEYSLFYVNEGNIINVNNWWGSNNPTYWADSKLPSKFYDIIYGASSTSSGITSWLVLNFNELKYLSADYIIDSFSKKIKYHNFSLELLFNNLGEDLRNNISLNSWVFDIKVNSDKTYSVVMNNSKGELIFSLDEMASYAILTLNGHDYIRSFAVDNVAPLITYITPTTTFSDEVLVEIKCDDDSAIIFYTLNATNPLYCGVPLIYKNPFIVNKSTTVHVVAVDASCNYYELSVTYLKGIELNDSGAIWSQYQGNCNNTGVSNYTGPLTNISNWSNLDIASSGSAVIDKNGHIYIAGSDGYLYCLNSQGRVIWRYGTTSKIICTPTIGYDGNIYFSNWMNSSLYCISPYGKLLWKYNLDDYNSGSSPVFGPDGTLYVLSGNDNKSVLFAFKNRVLLWNSTLPSILASTPAIGSDGTIYVIAKDHRLVAVNWDGTIKFIKTISNDDNVERINSHLSVSIANGLIYVLNKAKYRNCINAYYLNGTLKWSIHFSADSGTPSYYNGVLYIASIFKLKAIDASSGDSLWSKDIVESAYSLSSPLISGDGIIYVSSNNIVYAFTLSGVQLWNCTLSGKYGDPVSYSSPTLSNDGTLIVTTNQGIFAFNDVGADFMYKHVDGTELTFQFWECSTKGNNTYYWSFGDGVTSSEQNPIHTYNKAGKYKVILIVNHNGVNLVRNRTIEIDSYDITPPSDVSAFINNELTTGGIFSESQNITLSASDESGIVEIYYTIDGSNPINSETRKLYREKIIIEAYAVLKAVAFDSFGNKGQISSFIFNITDAINVKDKINSTLINKIQDLLDNAEAGSKFIFDYLELYGANFTINKPLNIITNNNTKLFGNGVQPVFTFTKSAKGSSLNGFVIENIDVNGILINNTSNISILNCIISANNSIGINIVKSIDTLIKYSTVVNSTDGIIINQSNKTLLNRVVISESYNNGIYILNSQGSVIANSTLNNNGKDWYNSKANQILLDNSMNTKLLSNEINYGFFGIHLINNNINLFIDNNKVYEGSGDAVLLMGRYSNINITHNILEGCFNGINFNGYNDNVNVERNLIWKMHYHPGEPETFADYKYVYDGWNWQDTYGQYNNAIEISCYSQNFHRGVHIEDNICILTQHRAWEARHTHDHVEGGCIGYGYNLFDGSDSYSGVANGATYYVEGRVDLVVDRVGDSAYRLRLINRLDNHYLSEIPAFDVIFTAGGYIQKVKFVGGEALAVFDVASSINIITATISSYISKSVMWNIPISEGYNSSNRVNDPGFEKGEAIGDLHHSNSDSPNENNHHNSGNGAGKGSGAGSGAGAGKGSGAGHGGTSGTHDGASSGREGDVRGNANNLVKSDSGTSASVGVDAAAKGDDVSFEGGSDSGEDVNAYEINKSVDVNKNMVYIAPFILFIVLVLVVVGYKRRKDDGY